MNKILTKVTALCVGLAMVAGVGVAVGSKAVSEVKAAIPSGYTLITSVSSLSNGDKVVLYNETDDEGVTGTSGTKDASVGSSGWIEFTVGKTTNGFNLEVSSGTYVTLGTKSYTHTSTATDLSVTSNGYICTVANSDNILYHQGSYVRTYTGKSGDSAYHPFAVYKVESGSTTCTVTYDANGGSGTMTDTTEYESGETVTVHYCEFLPADNFHEFSKFNTKADGSGTSYMGGETFSINANVTLYAIWDCKNVTIGNGSYHATFPYSNPYPSDFAINNSDSAQVGVMSLTASGLGRAGSYDEYELQVSGSVTFKNHTNAPVTKVVVNIYQYDNFKLSVGSTVIHAGDGTKKSSTASPYAVECDVASPSTDDIVLQHYSGSGTYTQKFFTIDFYFKLGSDVVHPTDVSLNAESGFVYIGKTRQLTATVLPADADDKTVLWSSSNTAVATVDANGLVTGVANGSATITATTNDGGLTASFAASVKTIDYGSPESPLSVEEARDVLEPTGSTITSEYVSVIGVVSSSSYDTTHNNYTIWLKSSDGSVSKYFELYGTNIDSSITDDYTASNALVGYRVVCTGLAKIYNGTYEITFSGSDYPNISSVKNTPTTFASAVISLTKEYCDAYVDGETDYDSYKETFEGVWSTLEKKFDSMIDEDKITVRDTQGDEGGSSLEIAMARYDFLTSKYNLDNFITGRSIPASRYISTYEAGSIDTSSSVAIIIVVAVASMTLLGTTLIIRKRKHQ